MTTPDERMKAVLQTREFLRELQSSECYPNATAELRKQALLLMRHFPSTSDLKLCAQALPQLFSTPSEHGTPSTDAAGGVVPGVDAAILHLAPKRPSTAVPHVLALDLEGVLISNAVSVFPRGGLYRFLTCVRGLFNRIVMFTTVGETRFREIANLLVEEQEAPAWFSSIEYVVWQGKTKDLRFVPGAEVGQVLLVDDLELYIHPEQHASWVSIAGFEPPFTQDDDRELDRVLDELNRRVSQAP